MGKIFFTSDLHFGHENVIGFDNRPFSSVEEMDAELIKRWNEKVSAGDLVYVLGDFIWKTRNNDAPALLNSLNGQKYLIKGNHDRFLHNAKAIAALAAVKDYADISNTATYYLVIADEQGLQMPQREQFQIDIAFAVDEFDFFS